MPKYPSWPTTDQGNIVGGRLANEMYHRFTGALNALSNADQKDAALAELLATTGDVFNVKSFGAKGDGATDDSTAIQAAHDALPSFGGIIFCPPGNYLIKSTLALSKRIRFSGAGRSILTSTAALTRIIKASTLNGAGIKVTGSNDSNGSVLEGFVLDGESGNGGDGIAVENNRTEVANVTVQNQGRDGIRIGADTATNVNLWSIQNCRVSSNGRHGLNIDDPSGVPDVNGGTVVHLDSIWNAGDGVRIGKAVINSFFGVTVQVNTGAGIRLTANAVANRFFGGDWDEGNVGGDLVVEAGAADNAIIFPLLTAYTDAGTRTIVFLAGKDLPVINRQTFDRVLRANLEVNSTTPSVAKEGSFWESSNTQSTLITDFPDGFNGQRIAVRLDVKTGIANDSAKIRLRDGITIPAETRFANDIISFVRLSNVWFEEHRNWTLTEVGVSLDLDHALITGGFRQTLDGWFQDDVAAGQTAVVLTKDDGATFTAKWIAIRAGSITGINIKSNAARSAGTLTAEAYKNGSATGLTAVLDDDPTTFAASTQTKDTDSFVAGDELDIRITTDGSWAPTTADIRAALEVET